MTLIVSLGYALSRLVVRTKFAFLKTCGGVNVPGSTCFDCSGSERFNSAHAKLESAAMQLVRKEDLILNSSQAIQSCMVDVWRRNVGYRDVHSLYAAAVASCSLRPAEFRHTSALSWHTQLETPPTAPPSYTLLYQHEAASEINRAAAHSVAVCWNSYSIWKASPD
jgi:hypothetical protein